jgi:hypothetical protein
VWDHAQGSNLGALFLVTAAHCMGPIFHHTALSCKFTVEVSHAWIKQFFHHAEHVPLTSVCEMDSFCWNSLATVLLNLTPRQAVPCFLG